MSEVSRMERWSDRIHPLIVKELRQSARSGAAKIMILGGFVAAGTMLTQLSVYGETLPLDRPVGREVFMSLIVILYLVALLLILTQGGNRIRTEREPGQIDLLYATPLSASSIVWAKLFCGLYEALLLFSVGLPMLFLTTLLRGVDVTTVVVSLILSVPLLLGPLQVTIFVGALHVGKTIKGIVGLLAMIIVVPVSVAMFAGCVSALLFSGAGSFFTTVISAGGIGIIFVYGMVLMVLHGVTISLLTTAGDRQPFFPDIRAMKDSPKYHF